ncbi:hypothetical protein [Yersinia bercovieri]
MVSGFLSLYVVFSLFISTYNSSGEVTVYGVCLLSVLMINIIITLSAAWFFFRRHMKTKKSNDCLLYFRVVLCISCCCLPSYLL